MSIVLGLDIGTSKLAALAWRSDTRQVLATRSVSNDSDAGSPEGARHEQDPQAILSRALALLRDLLARGSIPAPDVAAIGVTGQMHGVVLVGPDGQPATPFITWRDRRTLQDSGPGSLHAARRLLRPDAARRAGCELHAGYGGATLHWLAQHRALPEQSQAQGIADHVAAALCGIRSTTPDFAASWGLYDLVAGGWDADSLSRLGIPDAALPPVRPAAAPLGRLLPGRAAELGLDERTRVCAPVGDNQASVIGAAQGCPHTAVVNLGTGGQISIPRREYAYTEGLETRPMPLGGYISVGASLCGGWAYATLCRFFRQVAEAMTGVPLAEDEAYARLNRLAAAAPAGAGGLSADTRYSGTRGDPEQRGGFANVDAHNLTAPNVARAVLEGMVDELAQMAGRIGLHDVTGIVASGNAVRQNPLLREIIAARFGLECRVSGPGEEAALGAAMGAARGLETGGTP